MLTNIFRFNKRHYLVFGRSTAKRLWAINFCFATVDGKQWEVAVKLKNDGEIFLSWQPVLEFNTHYYLYDSDEVEFEPAYGRNLFVRIRNYDWIEIHYGSAEHKKERKPNDKNGTMPTLCLLLWDEGLTRGLLPILASWGKHYPAFVGSEVELVVADGMKLNLLTNKRSDDTFNLTGKEIKYFINHYCHMSGHRLMFEYLDDALFRVIIMDANGVEIHYPKVNSVGINIEEIVIPTKEGGGFEEFCLSMELMKIEEIHYPKSPIARLPADSFRRQAEDAFHVAIPNHVLTIQKVRCQGAPVSYVCITGKCFSKQAIRKK
ncbi:hypothetical protein ACFE04_019497 [Oxalis oulophora]